jgi:hypothetical protein
MERRQDPLLRKIVDQGLSIRTRRIYIIARRRRGETTWVELAVHDPDHAGRQQTVAIFHVAAEQYVGADVWTSRTATRRRSATRATRLWSYSPNARQFTSCDVLPIAVRKWLETLL